MLYFFLVSDRRIEWACRFSCILTMGDEWAGGRKTVTTQRKHCGWTCESAGMICAKSPGPLFFLRISCLDAFIKFSHSLASTPSVCDFAQPGGFFNTDLRFFYYFSLLRGPWFSRMTCTLIAPCVADTARCPTHTHFMFFTTAKAVSFGWPTWPVKKQKTWFSRISCSWGLCKRPSPGQWDVSTGRGLPPKALIRGWPWGIHLLGLLFFVLLPAWNMDAAL